MNRSGDRFQFYQFKLAVIVAGFMGSLVVYAADSNDLSPINMLCNPSTNRPSVFKSKAAVMNELQKQFEDEVVAPIFKDLYEKGQLYPRGRDNILQKRAYSAEIFAKPPLNPPIPLPKNACKDETVRNILDDSELSDCGKMSYVGFISQDSVPKTFFSLPNNKGSCESSLLAGVLLVALSEVEIEIIQEIQANRITWDPNSGAGPTARDLIEVLKQIRALPNLDKIADCQLPQNTTEGRCSAYRYVDSLDKQSRNMLMNFLRMRLVDGAAVLYRAFTLNAMDEIRQNALTVCEPGCEDQSDANACLQSCYKTKFMEWIKNKSKSKFPKVAEACDKAGGIR